MPAIAGVSPSEARFGRESGDPDGPAEPEEATSQHGDPRLRPRAAFHTGGARRSKRRDGRRARPDEVALTCNSSRSDDGPQHLPRRWSTSFAGHPTREQSRQIVHARRRRRRRGARRHSLRTAVSTPPGGVVPTRARRLRKGSVRRTNSPERKPQCSKRTGQRRSSSRDGSVRSDRRGQAAAVGGPKRHRSGCGGTELRPDLPALRRYGFKGPADVPPRPRAGVGCHRPTRGARRCRRQPEDSTTIRRARDAPRVARGSGLFLLHVRRPTRPRTRGDVAEKVWRFERGNATWSSALCPRGARRGGRARTDPAGCRTTRHRAQAKRPTHRIRSIPSGEE